MGKRMKKGANGSLFFVAEKFCEINAAIDSSTEDIRQTAVPG
jgi:hypothetical protein